MLQFTAMSSHMDSVLKTELAVQYCPELLVAVDLINPWRNILIQNVNKKRAHKQD